MSRAQWGHGYYAGLAAAEDDKAVREFIKIALPAIINSNVFFGRDSAFPMRLFRFECLNAGYSESFAKRAYDYMRAASPEDLFGAYISGLPDGEWLDDYIVLPEVDLTEAIEYLKKRRI